MCMLSITLVHPATAVGQNELPFGRDTRAVPSNTVLEQGPGPPQKGRFRSQTPQFTALTPVIKLALVFIHSGAVTDHIPGWL